MFKLDRLSIGQTERRFANALREKLEQENILLYILDVKIFQHKHCIEPRVVYSFSHSDWEEKINAMNQGLLYEDTHEAFGLFAKSEYDMEVIVDILKDRMKVEQKYDWRGLE